MFHTLCPATTQLPCVLINHKEIQMESGCCCTFQRDSEKTRWLNEGKKERGVKGGLKGEEYNDDRGNVSLSELGPTLSGRCKVSVMCVIY